jgi:hypothetical protein
LAARATGVLTAAEVAERTDALEAKLKKLMVVKPPGISGEDVGRRLAGLGDRISDAMHMTTDRKSALEALASLPKKYATANAEGRLDNPALVRLRREVSDAQERLERAAPVINTANAAVQAQRSVIATLEQSISILEATRTDLSRRAQLVKLIAADENDRSVLVDAITRHRSTQETADLIVSQHSEAVAKVARLRSLAVSAKAVLGSMSDYFALEKDAEIALLSLKAAQANAEIAAASLAPLLARSSQLQTQIADATQDKAAADRHASAISAALSQLASHLHDDETNCPVCQTHFEPKALKALAGAAAASSDARLSQADEALEALRAEEANLSPRIETLRVQVAAPARQERISAEAAKEATDTRAAIARTLSILPENDIAAIASARAGGVATTLAAAEAVLEPLVANAAAAIERRSTSSSELEYSIARESQLGTRLSQFRAEDVACAERIASRNLPIISLDELERRLTDHRERLEAARAQLVELSDAASAEVAGIQREQAELDAAQSELAAAGAARAEANQFARQMALHWTLAGLADVPSQANLARSLAAINATLAALRSLTLRQAVLARDNENALLQDEVDEVVASMRKTGGEAGATNPAQHLADLQAKLVTASGAVRLTQEARSVVNSYSEGLQTQANDFSSHVLDPLNVVIDDFNEAMLSTPGESIQFKASTRVDATSFGMGLRYREKVENAIEARKDLPPQVVLSEGQLAANGFSILCAASTAYPWSRWRALLLDDPLQHNDIIHTAAFVDVMRNMVELNGYQLIMSSHDRGESDFIARKFDAAGLPCSTILLTAPSDKGVVWAPPVQNQAAARVLRHDAKASSANRA